MSRERLSETLPAQQDELYAAIRDGGDRQTIINSCNDYVRSHGIINRNNDGLINVLISRKILHQIFHSKILFPIFSFTLLIQLGIYYLRNIREEAFRTMQENSSTLTDLLYPDATTYERASNFALRPLATFQRWVQELFEDPSAAEPSSRASALKNFLLMTDVHGNTIFHLFAWENGEKDGFMLQALKWLQDIDLLRRLNLYPLKAPGYAPDNIFGQSSIFLAVMKTHVSVYPYLLPETNREVVLRLLPTKRNDKISDVQLAELNRLCPDLFQAHVRNRNSGEERNIDIKTAHDEAYPYRVQATFKKAFCTGVSCIEFTGIVGQIISGVISVLSQCPFAKPDQGGTATTLSNGLLWAAFVVTFFSTGAQVWETKNILKEQNEVLRENGIEENTVAYSTCVSAKTLKYGIALVTIGALVGNGYATYAQMSSENSNLASIYLACTTMIPILIALELSYYNSSLKKFSDMYVKERFWYHMVPRNREESLPQVPLGLNSV